jgi:tetratricopeptide (TPR) repeat protein
MEYVGGGNLRHRMQRPRPIAVSEARRILMEVVQALRALSQAGIVHRDLKPENILLDEEGHVKVTDFGIAVADYQAGQLTTTSQVLGSFDYMAPEQRGRGGIDARADQYSLAVIAYELLTGRPPMGNFPPPSKLNAALDPSIDAVLLRGLSVDPRDRFACIEQFGRQLDDALNSTGSRMRRPWRVVGLTAAVIVVACVATQALVQGFYARQSDGPKELSPQSPTVADPPQQITAAEPAEDRRRELCEYYMARGESHHQAGRMREAESCLTEAIRLHQGDPRPLLMRALIYKKLELYQAALDDLQRAIELDDTLADAWTGRGSVYVQLQDYARAIPDLDRAVQLAPSFAEPRAWRGRAWHKLDQHETALQDFQEALKIDAECGIAYSFRALLWLGKNQYGAALEDLEQAARCLPDDPHVHSKLADFLALCPDQTLRDPVRAVEHATRACELTQWKGWKELRYLAKAHAANGNVASAIRCCEIAQELAPPVNQRDLESQLAGYRRRSKEGISNP